MSNLVKLCVLGSTGVGKTSFVEQFLYNDFVGNYRPTKTNGDTYNFSVILNSNLYQVKIIDMPMINYFPANTLYEWSDYRGCALRNANAYILIFDLLTPATFHYIKVIRDQLFESRNMQNIPVWVVGNKADLCMNILASMRGHRDHHHLQTHLHHHYSFENMTPAFKELASLIKKQWKCSYLECSAKYNWRVLPIFRDIFKTLEISLIHDSTTQQHRDFGEHSEPFKVSVVGGQTGAFRNLHNTTSNNNSRSCVIL